MSFSASPNYISNEKSNERLDYKEELDQVLKIWTSSGLSLDGVSSDDGGITIQRQLFDQIQELLKKHKAVSANNKEKAIRLFESCIPNNKPSRNTLLPIVEQWWEVTEWFMEKTHDSGRNEVAPNEQKLRHKFELFESFLAAIAQKFYDTTDELDEILKEPNLEQVEKAIALLIHPQHFNYFFNHLQNPDWIKPLKKKGFFLNPPQVIEDASQSRKTRKIGELAGVLKLKLSLLKPFKATMTQQNRLLSLLFTFWVNADAGNIGICFWETSKIKYSGEI